MTILEKFGLYMSTLVIILMLFLIAFSQNGLLDYHMLKKKHINLTNQVDDIKNENQKIEQEIKRLQSDSEYIRHLAKHEHEMAEKEELIFKTVTPSHNKTSKENTREVTK